MLCSSSKRSSASFISVAVAVAISASVLQAAEPEGVGQQEDADQDAKVLPEIIVTGTRKVGMAVDDSPAPVQIVTAEALQESGAPDLMNSLAFQVPSFNASQQGTDMASATLVASMRALSPNHTLVLVNGKRRHFTSNVAVLGAYAGAASADLSFIPGSAIVSTEVLTDGAAALYGSDAIAGVVNLITKKDFSGGSARMNVSGYDAGGGLSKNYQGNIGFGSAAGYFNLALEFENRDTVNRPGSIYGPAACVAARLASAAGCPATNSGVTPSGYPTSTGNAALTRENEYNMIFHPFYPYNSHQGDPPDIDRKIAFFSSGLHLNDVTELYATGSFGLKSTSSAQSYRRPSQDGGYDANGDGDRTDAIGGIGLRSHVALTEADLNKYPLGFTPNIETDEMDWSLGAGISGEVAGWSYDLSSNYGRNEMDIQNTGSMNFTLWNRYGISPESFYIGSFESSQWTTSLDLSRNFDWGLAIPVTFATGLEYRKDEYGIGAGEEASYFGAGAAAFPGYSPLAAGKYKRHNVAAFANLILYPTASWLVDVAGRFEDYSDFGSKAVGKITTRYELTDSFAIRGTYSTGFRAPTMGENYYTAIQVGPTGATATIAAANVGSGLKPETSRNISVGFVFRPLPGLTTTVDAYQIKIDDRTRIGNFAYSVAQSTNTRTGRAGGTPVSTLPDPADTDGNGVPDAEYNRVLGDALVTGGYIGVWNDPTAPGGSFDASARANINLGFFSNVLDTKSTGVDWVTTYNTQFDWGDVDWLLAANYNKTEVTRAGRAPGFETIPLFSVIDVWGIEKNNPEYRINVGATVHVGDKFLLNIRENIYGPQSTITSASAFAVYPQIMSTLDIVDPAKINGIASLLGLPATTTPYYKQEIGVLATTSLELTYKPMEGLSVGIGADNLFDKYPDKTPAAIRQYNAERYAATGARDYLLGSPIGFFGRRLYAKANYNW
jgi:iron complex outermembrane recepter protein